jgi:glycosyltransferase involved in cell wall biosynthesis
MIDILAISGSSVTAINRNVYVELKERGWRIELLVPNALPVSETAVQKADPPRASDPVIHFEELKGTNPRLFFYPALEKILDELKPAVILLENDPVSRLAVDAGNWCRKNNAYLFCLSCENLSFDIFATLKRRGWRSLPAAFVKWYLYRRGRSNVNTVFTINNDGTRLFRRKGYSYVKKIPLGFDPAVFYPDETARTSIRTKLGLQFPVIAYFGRLVPEKGVHLIVEALKNLRSYDWHFMLDKFDLYANDYNKQIDILIRQAGIEDRVVYIDADHFEIAAYMNASDVVVIPSVSTPSWKEQYGRVAPEAMACGKLVIAAKSGALPELIGEAGMLFEEGDVTHLTTLLENFLKQPEAFQHFSAKATARANGLLSIPMQAAAYELRMSELQIKGKIAPVKAAGK